MTRQQLIEINREFRRKDESAKWPIRGRFNATERAIRQARRFRQDYGDLHADEYSALLDQLISTIVNDPRNF